MTEESEAGVSSPVTAGAEICPTITKDAPLFTACWNGTSSFASRSSKDLSVETAPSWESPAVAPCPGKCFTTLNIWCSFSPCISAQTISATSWLSEPNDRSLITVLSGFVNTSATGAKSILKPSVFRYVPIVLPALYAFWESPVAPTSLIFPTSVTPKALLDAILATVPPSSSTPRNTGIPTIS